MCHGISFALTIGMNNAPLEPRDERTFAIIGAASDGLHLF
jgi:hypothetical protein